MPDDRILDTGFGVKYSSQGPIRKKRFQFHTNEQAREIFPDGSKSKGKPGHTGQQAGGMPRFYLQQSMKCSLQKNFLDISRQVHRFARAYLNLPVGEFFFQLS